MAVLTLAALVAASAPLWPAAAMAVAIALWLVIAGAALTALRRAARVVSDLKDRERG
jgi:membrane protein implicated in regulation of membrane protease activity